MYPLYCQGFVGTTDNDIQVTVMRHIDSVVEEVTKMAMRDKNREADSEEQKNNKAEAWSQEFAQHFAKHCKPKGAKAKLLRKQVSKEDVVKICQQTVKVEVLRRHDGAELYWE